MFCLSLHIWRGIDHHCLALNSVLKWYCHVIRTGGGNQTLRISSGALGNGDEWDGRGDTAKGCSCRLHSVEESRAIGDADCEGHRR